MCKICAISAKQQLEQGQYLPSLQRVVPPQKTIPPAGRVCLVFNLFDKKFSDKHERVVYWTMFKMLYTTLRTPDLSWSRKLSRVVPGFNLDGRAPGNTRCCKLFALVQVESRRGKHCLKEILYFDWTEISYNLHFSIRFQKLCQLSTWSAKFTIIIIIIHFDMSEYWMIVQCLSHIVNQCLVSIGATIARMRSGRQEHQRKTTYRFNKRFQKLFLCLQGQQSSQLLFILKFINII